MSNDAALVIGFLAFGLVCGFAGYNFGWIAGALKVRNMYRSN